MSDPRFADPEFAAGYDAAQCGESFDDSKPEAWQFGYRERKPLPARFTDAVVFHLCDPVKEQEIRDGKAAFLNGQPIDRTKSDAWQLGWTRAQSEAEGKKLWE